MTTTPGRRIHSVQRGDTHHEWLRDAVDRQWVWLRVTADSGAEVSVPVFVADLETVVLRLDANGRPDALREAVDDWLAVEQRRRERPRPTCRRCGGPLLDPDEVADVCDALMAVERVRMEETG